MNERVLIIVGIIAQYFMSEDDFSNEHEIVEELLGAGFKEDEISEAFVWMEKITLNPDQPQQSPKIKAPSMRLFSPEEQDGLSVAAQDFLLKLRLGGIISPEIEEEIIIKACQAAEEQQCNLTEVKSLTVLTMFADLQKDHSREIDCIIGNKLEKLYN
ncbi:MAG: hypothetical protein B6I36_03505 [Desulfobacteraceae bacterium 4572_35.1]|nr:MAG: hypothetical protein B6I36_03505 [Desulfobacteraceae bacterium 4572_35.1]